MKNVENKVIIITGASSGIGAETARVLAREGAKVVLSARRADRFQELANELGENVAFLPSDVANAENMTRLVKLAKETFEKVDAVFANAGIMPAGNIANAVLYAVSQPDNVDVSDLVVRSTLEG